TVSFYEVSAQVHRLIATVRTARGSVPFTVTAGRGRRQIVADVYVDGAPQTRTVVGGYSAPAFQRMPAVRRLRIRRLGSRLTVTFARVRGARSYAVYALLSTGARRALITRGARVVLASVFPDARGTVTVRALGDGIYTANGPAAKARFGTALRSRR
ncbi:MAG: hypothetical protein ACYC0H_09555, partial [Solirubrobacteraceae bacterium]